jgi:hypothetical protein
MSTVRAISLWQPWASLWLSPRKLHETRHWATKHRGPLVVHAAKRIERVDPESPLGVILEGEFGKGWYESLPRGAILGVVELLDCRRTEEIWAETDELKQCDDDYYCGDFSPRRFGWLRGDYSRFPEPIPYRGQQALFSIPREVLLAALGRAA